MPWNSDANFQQNQNIIKVPTTNCRCLLKELVMPWRLSTLDELARLENDIYNWRMFLSTKAFVAKTTRKKILVAHRLYFHRNCNEQRQPFSLSAVCEDPDVSWQQMIHLYRLAVAFPLCFVPPPGKTRLNLINQDKNKNNNHTKKKKKQEQQ